MELKIERKRTSHSTPCHICDGEIQKGDLRVVIRSYGYHSQDSAYIHVSCLRGWINECKKTLLDSSKKPNTDINPSRRDTLEV